ncbi:competence protein ComFC [Azospirillaceae bacterium]
MPVSAAASLLVRMARRVVDATLPPRCLSCGGWVDRDGGVCPACWRGLNFIGPPLCGCCGLPFEVDTGANLTCAACVANPPPFARARSALVYDDGSRPLVLGLKHGDQTWAAPGLGGWLARAGAELLAGGDALLVPVPLHRWRLFRRRFNQAALIAQAIHRMSGVAVAPDLLVRRRATPSQGGLSRDGRTRNIKGAFAVRPGREKLVEGRRLVVVDDVLTTGATVSECARVLLRAGAAGVDVLTLARVVRVG